MNEIQENRKKSNLVIVAGMNNALKCSKGKAESLSHRIVKFWICNYCWENSIDFATEVVFKDNQRADIVIKDWAVCIEILGSETKNRFINKSYPLPTIPIQSTTGNDKLITMLADLHAMNGKGWDFYLKKFIEEDCKETESYKDVVH